MAEQARKMWTQMTENGSTVDDITIQLMELEGDFKHYNYERIFPLSYIRGS